MDFRLMVAIIDPNAKADRTQRRHKGDRAGRQPAPGGRQEVTTKQTKYTNATGDDADTIPQSSLLAETGPESANHVEFHTQADYKGYASVFLQGETRTRPF